MRSRPLLLLPRGAALGLLALALAPAVSPLLGQDGEREPASPAAREEQEEIPSAPDERWRLFEGEITLEAMIDSCSALRGVPITFERGTLDQVIRVQPNVGMTPNEIWRMAHREMMQRGLTTVQSPGSDTLSVVPLGDAASLSRVEPFGIEEAKAGYVRVLLPLTNKKSEELIETVRVVLSKEGGEVQELRGANALVISDLYWHVQQALFLVHHLDLAAGGPIVLELPVEDASAVGLAGVLDRIVAARKLVSPESELKGKVQALPETNSLLLVAPENELEEWRQLIERFDRSEGVVTEHYQPRRFGLTETAQLIEQVVHPPDSTERPGSWRLVEDGLTGTLILTTTPSRQREVARLLARLESTRTGARRPMKTFPIRNRQVAEVLEVLRQLLDAGAIEAPASIPVAGEGVEGPTASIPAPAVRSGRDEHQVVLTADEPTNRLIAVGEAALLDQLGPLIKTIDVRGHQVLVEAMVVSMTDSDAKALGVELRKVGVSNDVLYELSSLFGLGAVDPDLPDIPGLDGTGASAALLDPGSFSAVVNALQTLTEGRSLDMPRMLVNNNQEASLNSVVESPYLITTSNNTAATTAFGGSLDAGTTVTVKPQVAEGDQLVLEYSVSLSAFLAPPADPSLPPPRQQNVLSSVVTVPDGFTVVVGGLELEQESETVSQVPILGDIPLLGLLFRNKNKTLTKDKFFVFLRCSVLRASDYEDLKYITQRELPKVGLGEDWPRLQPRVMR